MLDRVVVLERTLCGSNWAAGESIGIFGQNLAEDVFAAGGRLMIGS